MRRTPSRCASIEPLEPRLVLDSTVVLNEIMYHPPGDDEALEWIELHNQMAVDMDISGWQLGGGVEFTFAEGTVLAGGAYLVIAADPTALAAASGLTTALGPFRGELANGGDRIELRNNSQRLMDAVEFADDEPWPVAPDGSGATLAKRDPNSAGKTADNWSSSRQVGGTPAARNFPPRAGGHSDSDAESLVFNEIASAQDGTFRLELANLSGSELNAAGYVIVSSDEDHAPFVIPEHRLDPNGLLVLSELELGFDAQAGDRLYLFRPGRTGVVDARVVTDRLQGRAAEHDGDWLFPAAASFGAANPFDLHADVVINEIMYHARDEYADEEWIELVNRSAQAVELSGWRLSGGIQFEFAHGTSIGPGQYLVVAVNAQALAARYPDVADRMVGDFSGRLSNDGDSIVLRDATGNPADEVHYYDAGRWSQFADGRGSSLELRDPDADNLPAEAWSASDESERSRWIRYSYVGLGTSVGSDPTLYHEFLLGLLDAGEMLLDDISVIEDPGGPGARQLIQNGDFETDAIGTEPAAWRIIGTQHGRVTTDPDDPANRVLQLTATGPTEHMHNNAGTTLKDGVEFVSINPNLQYEISFRAKWLAGSNQLNTRLYFNRLGRTTLVDVPDRSGSPGLPNSVRQENIGPTYAQLCHSPVVPDEAQPVTVSVAAADPDGVASMTLWYAVDGGEFHELTMTAGDDGRYAATIPGQAAASIVQFYVAGVDGLGADAAFPAAGADSRALYIVQDGQSWLEKVHNFRIVMTAADADFLHETTNVMSNDRLGATVIYDEQEVFYDVGVRLKGSQRGRDKKVRVGFNVQFDPQQLFRGVHETVAIDRSGAGDEFHQKEILVKHGINHAGQLPSMYDDIIHVITPRADHTGSALLSMARYTDVFLDSQYENGSLGTAFEYELVYYPSGTVDRDPEGLKLPNPDNVVGVSLGNLGADKEAYRWYWLIKNNRPQDDYSALIAALTAIGQAPGEAFHADTQRLLDVDEWLRAFAVQILFGIGDNYATSDGPWHNMQIYTRPSDGKTLFLPWDMDFTFSQGSQSGLTPNGDLRKLLTDPGNEHAYYGHLYDIVDTTFNAVYMQRWIDHYGSLVRPEGRFAFVPRYVSSRSKFVLQQLPARVRFAQTAGETIDVGPAATATISGTGWIDVREIRLAGSDEPLDVTWRTVTSWEAVVPVDSTINELTFAAFDFQGRQVGRDTIGVRSSAPPVRNPLVISEVNYSPFAPTTDELAVAPGLGNEDFEFVEIGNVGREAMNLAGFRIAGGVEFTFPSLTLEAGQYAVIVQDREAFQLRYGTQTLVVGAFAEGRLNNGGETLALIDATGETIGKVAYDDDDAWPRRADGGGATLEVVNVLGDGNDAANWRASSEYGGSPGRAGTGPRFDVVINEVLARGSGSRPDLIELYNTTGFPLDLSGWYLSDDPEDLTQYAIPDGTTISGNGYLVFEQAQFGFGLSGSRGDEVWLVESDAHGRPVRFADHVDFGATVAGVSMGRWRDGDPAARLFPMREQTFGAANSGPRTGEMILAEVHYHPQLVQFYQDFDTGAADGLTPIQGDWSIDGYYAVMPGPEGDAFAVVTAPGARTRDLRIRTLISTPSDTEFNQNGVVLFDYQGPTDFKFVSMHARAGLWRMGQRDDQGWRFLAEAEAPIALDSDHEVVIEIAGSVAVLRADGLRQIRYDFGELLADGLVGIGSKSGHARFDDLLVESVGNGRELEFLELRSVTDQPLDLAGWRVDGAVAFTLPAGTNLAAGQSLVLVGFDPNDALATALFRGCYGIDASVLLVGAYTGSLDNAGEDIRLLRPLDANDPRGERVLVDRVTYDDEPPWPTAAGGLGSSLERTVATAYGDFATSWAALPPTPGAARSARIGDLDFDGDIDTDDTRQFARVLANPPAYTAAHGESAAAVADVDGDGEVDFDDIDDFVTLMGGTAAGSTATMTAAVPNGRLHDSPVRAPASTLPVARHGGRYDTCAGRRAPGERLRRVRAVGTRRQMVTQSRADSAWGQHVDMVLEAESIWRNDVLRRSPG